MAKISIIVPVYNTARYLETCLTSLKFQTFSDIEVLLINDGSTDESEEMHFAKQITVSFCSRRVTEGFVAQETLDYKEPMATS